MSTDLGDAIGIVGDACSRREAVSVGLLGDTAEIYAEVLRRGFMRPVVTDQTAAHDAVNGYLPAGWTLEQWDQRREADPQGVARAAKESMAQQVRSMLEFRARGIPVFDYGNNIRADGEGCRRCVMLSHSRLHQGLYPAAVLRGRGAIPGG